MLCAGVHNLYLNLTPEDIMKNTQKLPPIEVLRQQLTYDPESGVLRRGEKSRYPGTVAGKIGGNGYIYVKLRVKYKQCGYAAHRIAYALHYGVDPYPMEIDHINRNPSDNRIINLRTVSRGENVKNSKRNNVLVRITYCGTNVITIAPSIRAAACVLGVHYNTICKHLNNNTYVRNNDYGCTYVRVERV